MFNGAADEDIGVARDEQSTVERPPTPVFVTAIVAIAWLLFPWWLILEPTAHGHVVFAVCTVFTLIALGIVAISAVRALHSRRTWKAAGATKWLSTRTGRLPMRAAMVQILLIPGSLAVAFTAIALVEVIVRG